MDISDVRVKLVRDPGERLKAVCTVTFDGLFVVRDVKVVEGTSGLFVAMPSQKLAVHCPNCHQKNHLRAKFCNECGTNLPPSSPQPDSNGRARLHRDIAHPIKAAFRQAMQERVLEAYNEEVARSESPGYEPEDYDHDSDDDAQEPRDEESRADDDRGSEYDDIIAELRGRSGGHAEHGPPKPQRRGDPASESAGDSPRDRSSKRRRGRRGQRREERAPQRTEEPAAEQAGKQADEDVQPRRSERERPAAKEDRTPESRRDEKAPAGADKAKETKSDDSLPFGHGIL